MSEILVTFSGGKRVDAVANGFMIRTDQSRANGGEGSAPEPYTLFLASLGTCAGTYVLGFCQARGLPTEGIRLVERPSFDPATRALSGVEIAIHVPPTFPEKYRDALVRVAEGCAVKKAIQAQPRFTIRTVVDAGTEETSSSST